MIRFALRVPDNLYDRLTESAKTNHRSINAHILHLIQQGLDREAALAAPTVAEGQALVMLTVGDTAHLVTSLHPHTEPLQVPATRIAEQAGLPVNELPGRRFTVARLTQDSADGFTLLDDPRN